MTISEIKKLQLEFDLNHAGKIPFFEEINENNIQALEHLIVCLVGEIGEFSNIVKKVRRGDYPLSEVKDKLDEELIDVFIYLIKISNQLNVDIDTGYLNKLKKNKSKFRRYQKNENISRG
ncbi:MazG-like family protein [Desulfotomaculum defluvii]